MKNIISLFLLTTLFMVCLSEAEAQNLVLCANSGGDVSYRGGESGSCKKNELELKLVEASTFCITLGLSKTVFVSSQKFSPDLVSEASNNFANCSSVTSGLEGADCICQELADAQTLGGTYKAWLSDSIDSPSTRFSQSSCPYVMVNNDIVAEDWADLVDGDIVNSIRIDETGANRSIGSDNDSDGREAVLTNTNSDGTIRGGNTCSDWTDNSSLGSGVRYGMVDESGPRWTDDPVFSTGCGPDGRFLYCFEQ